MISGKHQWRATHFHRQDMLIFLRITTQHQTDIQLWTFNIRYLNVNNPTLNIFDYDIRSFFNYSLAYASTGASSTASLTSSSPYSTQSVCLVVSFVSNELSLSFRLSMQVTIINFNHHLVILAIHLLLIHHRTLLILQQHLPIN